MISEERLSLAPWLNTTVVCRKAGPVLTTTAGRADGAGGGPPVVLLHGWSTSWFIWRETMQALAEAGYRVYAPDHIGCGESGKPALFYAPGDYRRYLDALLDGLGLKQCVLVGHSQGGHMALGYALARPERVQRLVLVGPAFSLLRQATATRMGLLLGLLAVPLVGELLMTLTPARLVLWLVGRPWGGFHHPERLAPQFLDRMAFDISVKASLLNCLAVQYLVLFSLPGLRRLRRDADLLSPAATLGAPVLLVWGKHDALLRPRSFPLLAKALPRGRAVQIDEAGHSPQVEAPQDFQRELLRFLAES